MSTDYCVYLMMKKYGLIILWTASLLLAATGCVQPVEIAPPAEREVFVKCVLEKGKDTQRAVLLYSGGIGEEDFKPVENATLVINGPVKSYSRKKDYRFNHIGNGVYEVSLEPVDGGEYSLKVAIPGRDTLEAVTRMPQSFSVSSLIIPPEIWLEEGNDNKPDLNPWAFFKCHISYERMRASGGRSLLSEMPGMIFHLDSLAHHHLYVLGRIEDSSGVIAPITQFATNHKLVDKVNANGKKYGLYMDAEISGASSRQRYDVYTKQCYSDLSLHDGYLRIDFPEDYDNGLRDIYQVILSSGQEPEEAVRIDATRYFAVVGDFNYEYWGTFDRQKPHPVLYFCSLSEEYDRYLKSVRALFTNAEGDLLTTLYRESSGYSNIRSGYGVFGAVSALRHDCDLQKEYVFGGRKKGQYVPYPAYPAPLPEL